MIDNYNEQFRLHFTLLKSYTTSGNDISSLLHEVIKTFKLKYKAIDLHIFILRMTVKFSIYLS